MNRTLFSSPAVAVVPSHTEFCLVPMECDGVTRVQEQLDKDILAMLHQDKSCVQFDLTELWELDQLLPDDVECVNMVMTNRQCRLLASYVNLCFCQAHYDSEDVLAAEFDQFLELLLHPTQITFVL